MKSEPSRWSRQGTPWTRRELKQLGKGPDSVLARRTGRTPHAMLGRRVRLHIPKADSKIPRWTPAEDKSLGTMPDWELARHLQRPLRGVKSRRVKLRILVRPPRELDPRRTYHREAF